MSSILIRFKQGFKKSMNLFFFKQRDEQPWTIAYTLVFKTMSAVLKVFFFGPNQLVFPSK